jgi:hypothetical protein
MKGSHDMARGRMIDRRISKSDKFAALQTDRARVLYFMIYPHTDREGRYSGDPREIKEDCCPRLKYSIKKIAEAVIDLDAVGLIRLYEVDDKACIEFIRFDDFQVGFHKDREAPSVIPAYSGLGPEQSGLTPLKYKVLSLSLRNIKNTSKAGISFDFMSKKFTEIQDEDLIRWKTAFPACDIKLCLSQMAEWILANPAKGKKSNYPKFITGWLKREQDKGGSLRGRAPALPPGEWAKKMEAKLKADREAEDKS